MRKREGGRLARQGLAGFREVGLGQIDGQVVGLAILDTVALLEGGVADRLRKMALAVAWRAEEERILPSRDEAPRGQVLVQSLSGLPNFHHVLGP